MYKASNAEDLSSIYIVRLLSHVRAELRAQILLGGRLYCVLEDYESLSAHLVAGWSVVLPHGTEHVSR